MSILAAIAVLGILIFVHELGHFAAARLQKIHVNGFSIGFGPALLKYQGPETLYAFRVIPLGGFVSFPDDDPESEIPPEDPNLLSNRPILDRAIVISAGVIANLVFAYLLLVGQVATVGMQEVNYLPGVLVPQVLSEKESVAARAGIQAGDTIVAVNNRELEASKDGIEYLMSTIQDSANKSIDLTVKRDAEIKTISLEPSVGNDGKGKIGVMLQPNNEIIRRRPDSLGEIFAVGAKEFDRITMLTFGGFWQLVTNFQETAQQVAGPVAIVAVGAELAQNDLANLFQFAALISINLAIINILPLPALDGGQLAFLAIEGLRGKPLPSRIQENIMQTGIVLLLGLGVLIIIRDTTRLDFFQQLFQ
ncbi:MAG: RIP metalloprotease RseP [Prochloraceae cyanobacterium]|nr:RIP metalloprotease RseP [Prochloraceae cyanobacterium]